MQPNQSPPAQPTSDMNIGRQIFDCILDWHERHQTLTKADIRALFLGQTEDIDVHLERLEQEGLIRLANDHGGNIELVPIFTPTPRVPIRGKFARGPKTVLQEDSPGYISVDLRGIGIGAGTNMSVIQVSDHCMIEAGIRRGDLVILSCSKPVSGDIVAIETDGGYTLRRFAVIADIEHLISENAEVPDIRPAWDIPICGVRWATIRMASSRKSASKRVVSYSGSSEGVASARLTLSVRPTQSAGQHTGAKRTRTKLVSPDLCRLLPPQPPAIGVNEVSAGYISDDHSNREL